MTSSSIHSPATSSERGDTPGELLVESVDVTICSLALPHPVRLGTAYYAEREYAVVRVTDGTGRQGMAYGYTRGLPILPLLEKAAHGIVGTDPRARGEAVQSITSTAPSIRSAMVRATSLVDIALWDLAGKQYGLALCQLLGSTRRTVPVMPVAGYFRDVRGDDAVIDEIVELERIGYAQIKLMVGALGAPATWSFLQRAREALSATTRLAVDAHYSFETIDEARLAARMLADIGVWMLEDPFLPTEWRRIRGLRTTTGPSIAAGEDVSEPAQFLDLLEAAAILRVDPTTCGGIRAAITALEAAAIRGVPVIPHVFTGLAAQFAGAYSTISCVEYIPSTTQADPIDAYFERPLHISGGQLTIDQAPGVGTDMRWNELQQHSTATITVRDRAG